MKTIQIKDINVDNAYSTEELITTCEELGLFRIHKVMNGENETGLWTLEVLDSY